MDKHIRRYARAGRGKPTFPVSRETVLCVAFTVPQASATDVVVCKLGNAAFISRCLRTRIARSGPLAVLGNRKRLWRFRSTSSGSSPCCCCLGGLDIVKLTVDRLLGVLVLKRDLDGAVESAAASEWINIGEVVWYL